MSRIFVVGVDPGISGGVCVLTAPSPDKGDGVVACFPTPVREGPGGKNVIDALGLASRLTAVVTTARTNYPDAGPFVPVVERVWAMSGEGVSSVFTFGKSTGTVIGVLEAMFGRRVAEIEPKVWQAAVLGKVMRKKAETKEWARAWAGKTYPAVSLLATPRSKVPHAGMVDALAIARYGLDAL
jgi:crossover junction endodeoxyribonuclease RuvC